MARLWCQRARAAALCLLDDASIDKGM